MIKRIKLFDPKIDESESRIINRTLSSHFWASGEGVQNVAKFEKKFRNYIGSDECIAVNSGTAALNLALSAAKIENTEVILPSLTFVSTANAVMINGAKPVFADVDPINLCIDPQSIKKLITKKTSVILPVHFAGMPCALNEIINICKEKNLTLVEDAAHAVGSKYDNKRIGRHGDFVCFSFHPVKNLAMPTGGIISINHKNYKKINRYLKAMRWCGITDRKGSLYDVKDLGNNYYMNEFSAAIGLMQLKKINKMNNRRKEIAKRYDTEITIEKKIPFRKYCSYHIYWILVKNRRNFMKMMTNNRVETGIHYKPIHSFSLYKNSTKLPITEKISKQIVSIPMHANISDDNADRIIRLVNKFAK